MQDRRSFLKTVATASVGVALAPGEVIGKEKGPDIPLSNLPSSASDSKGSLPVLDTDDPVLNKIRQARYVAAPARVKAASLGLLHYSDIHGDDIAVARLHEVIGKYGPYIDAVLATGDSVLYYADGTEEYPNDAKWWRASGLAEKSLFVLGNHDSAARSNEKGHLEGSADWDFKGKEWDFDTYFADYIGRLGYVMPNGYDKPSSPYYKSCFWHKDFAESKIRLLGLDCMHFNDGFRYLTSEQESWLSARLADTLDPSNPAFGYSVIVSTHYPLDDFDGDNEKWEESKHRFIYNQNSKGGRLMDHRTGDVNNFHSPETVSYVATKRFSMRSKVPAATEQYGYVSGPVNPLADIVQSWVDKGVKFVVWLTGHCHNDMLYYPAKYPGLLCLSVDQAGNLRGNSITDRGEDLESRFCANYYAVDTQNGLFKIVRFGLSMTRHMIRKDVLCYDYINKKVIFE
ncbi:MAG: hypothetical protein IKI00_03360 [Bacteroidales bacterium]|nr:hypothetical protein [Bacteroidales bacterium]